MNIVKSALALAIAWTCCGSVASAQAPDPNQYPQQQPVIVQQPQQQPQGAQPMLYAQPQQGYAQPPMEQPPRPVASNVLYIEGLGNGGVYSLNYERLIIPELALRIGFSYISISASAGSSSAKASMLTVPLMANYLGIGNDRHHLELGAGLVIFSISGSSSTGAGSVASGTGAGVYGTATIGYRFQPMSGGFVFRAGFTPLFGAGGFQAWGGLSLGAAF